MDNYSVRVLWEGQVLDYRDFGDYESTANGYYSSTVDFYRRSDPIEGGVSVQLLRTVDVVGGTSTDVEYETFID